MTKLTIYIYILLSAYLCSACTLQAQSPESTGASAPTLTLGAERISLILEKTEGKSVALIINQTSIVGKSHTLLADTLLSRGVIIKKIFAPEHGFRGNADAGESVADGRDRKTGLPIISLYGKNKKPTKEQLEDVDVVIFDIQDVGARFYTYTSTMLYAMQSCAEYGKEFIVLDRPNPNDYVEGPVLKDDMKSFVGTMPLPVLHGLTVGELAQMILGEGWSGDCRLSVIPMEGWQHRQPYSLPVKPSPNLPNDTAIRFYPSLCLFEGTDISVGRGTTTPFQMIGYPDPIFGEFTFTPVSLAGYDKNPLQKDRLCYGIDLRENNLTCGFSLKYIISFYKKSLNCKDFTAQKTFFSKGKFFDRLAGDSNLRQQIIKGMDEQQIRQSWQPELSTYREIRKKYLIYKD